MTKTLIKMSAIACALGAFAVAGPAYAVTLIPGNGTNLIVLAAEDVETEAVEEDMRPDIKAPGSQDEEAMPEGEAEGQATEPENEDIGEEEIERDMGKPEK